MRSNLLAVSILTALIKATPVKRWYQESLGANFLATNGFDGNQLVASYIMPDGHLQGGTVSWTNGNGSASINDPASYENHPDPFLSSGSILVKNDTVMVVNAGSSTFSVFNIDPTDPARPSFVATYPTLEFPVSLAASPDGSVVCALASGADNGFTCYGTTSQPWTQMQAWTRHFGLNTTTPPHGPVGGTPSQIIFAGDSSSIIVAVKGQLPTDLNNPTGTFIPGHIAGYAIGSDGSLAESPTMYPAAIPFSIQEDLFTSGVYFGSEASMGYEAWMLGTSSKTVVGSIPNQAASCWAGQSWKSKNYYTVDIGGKSNITEVAINPSTLEGHVVKHHGLGVNASGTDLSMFRGRDADWMYVNAPAYHSVHLFEISGPGDFQLRQRFGLANMPEGLVKTAGFAGQAVYYKP